MRVDADAQTLTVCCLACRHERASYGITGWYRVGYCCEECGSEIAGWAV